MKKKNPLIISLDAREEWRREAYNLSTPDGAKRKKEESGSQKESGANAGGGGGGGVQKGGRGGGGGKKVIGVVAQLCLFADAPTLPIPYKKNHEEKENKK